MGFQFEKPCTSIEILGFSIEFPSLSIEIQRFSVKLLGFLKICDKLLTYVHPLKFCNNNLKAYDCSHKEFILIFITFLRNCIAIAKKVSVFWVFLDRIFPHLDWMQNLQISIQISIFMPNVGKYGPEKLQIRTFFTQWVAWTKFGHNLTSRRNILWKSGDELVKESVYTAITRVLFRTQSNIKTKLCGSS